MEKITAQEIGKLTEKLRQKFLKTGEIPKLPEMDELAAKFTEFKYQGLSPDSEYNGKKIIFGAGVVYGMELALNIVRMNNTQKMNKSYTMKEKIGKSVENSGCIALFVITALVLIVSIIVFIVKFIS